jgi:hypothetical protein
MVKILQHITNKIIGVGSAPALSSLLLETVYECLFVFRYRDYNTTREYITVSSMVDNVQCHKT